MKTLPLFFVLIFSFQVFAESPSPVPPPPMPDYMKKHKDKFTVEPPGDREPQSLPEEPSAEDIKQEFLRAGEEDIDIAEPQDSQSVNEEPLVAAEPDPVEDEAPAPLVDEAPTKKEEIQEVSAVDESAPEFEQASMGEVEQENVTDSYLKDAGNEVSANSEPQDSNLGDVEENLEASEQVAEQNFNNDSREPTSDTPFKAGMYKFEKKCQMYKEPSSMGDAAGSIKAGRKLWVDVHEDSWHKVYKKSGAVYIPADCLK